MKVKMSVIIPAYNEEDLIKQIVEETSGNLDKQIENYEIIFIDDGSQDRTWERIKNVALKHEYVRGIRFSRNFGKEAAIFAGLKAAKGECVVVMDCDLQHPPKIIMDMYCLWQQGFEVIEGIKKTRGNENRIHGCMASVFYKIVSKAAGMDMQHSSDFKMMDRKVVDAILNIPEKKRFFRGLSFWVGFKSTRVEFEVAERLSGSSKWSFNSLVKYAILNMSVFSTAPMQLVTFLGMIMLVVSFILGSISLIQKIMGIALGGFTTVIIVLLFIGSIIMVSMGIMGYYIANIYEEVKKRPMFIVADTYGDESYEKVVG